MYIKSIKIKNFLSIGEESVFIDFMKYGNIVLLKGKNYDINEDEPTSNGSGKTSCFDAIVYALYGKTIRNLSHNDIINKKNKKGLEVELYFDNYRILRTRKPDSLKLWKDDKELTLGGMPATQELLDGIIKLSYNAFLNVAIFGQNQNNDFLSCPPGVKRKIVENLLSLEKYNKFCDVAKEEYKAIISQIKEQRIHYENALNNKDSYQNKLSQLTHQQQLWINKKTKELSELDQLLIIKKNGLNNTDTGNKIIAYEQSQIDLKEQNIFLVSLEESKEKCVSANTKIYEYLNNLKNKENITNNFIKDIDASIFRIKKDISRVNYESSFLENLQDGATCSVCFGIVSKENYEKVLNHNKNTINSNNKDIEDYNESVVDHKQELTTILDSINKTLSKQSEVKEKIKQIDTKISQTKSKIRELVFVEKPDTDSENRIVQEQVSSLGEKIFTIKHELNGGNPYKSIIQTITKELNECDINSNIIKNKIDSLSDELQYYEFWIDGFGDNGIRTVIIDDIIPTLNNRIDYWLHYLMDNKIKVSFDNNLNETITRNPPDGDPFVYNATSGGEKRRLDLAISQAFSYVMMIAAGEAPSVCVLDESCNHIDKNGVEGVYRMICELANERQVIVVTHDQTLLDLLENCETITMIKKNGFSTLEG